jgi:hypothetical protein
MNIDDWSEEVSFRDLCREVRRDSMPPANYRWLHPEARLSAADTAALCAWSERPAPR